MMMPLPHQILIILYRPTILSLYTGKRRHCQPLIVLLHLFLFNFIRSFNITVFSKQGMSAKKTYKPVMRSTADAEVASHASQWMLQKCKTSHFSYPDYRIVQSGSALACSLRVAKTPTYRVIVICQFPLFIALCDHNPPTLQTDRRHTRNISMLYTCRVNYIYRLQPTADLPDLPLLICYLLAVCDFPFVTYFHRTWFYQDLFFRSSNVTSNSCLCCFCSLSCYCCCILNICMMSLAR